MNIKNLNITKSKVVFAENVDSLNMDKSSISQSDLDCFLSALKHLNQEKLIVLHQHVQNITQDGSTNMSKYAKLQQFLVVNGVAIAQNLSASVIFEVLKNYFQ